MAEKVKLKKADTEFIPVFHSSDVVNAQRMVRAVARKVGFDKGVTEKLVIVVRELVSNIVKHAGRGRIVISVISRGNRKGIQIESIDRGKGITDIEEAMSDGFSTGNSLGY